MRSIASVVIALFLLSACTTTSPRISQEQRAAISTLAVQNFSTENEFTVEFQEVDTSDIGLAAGGIVGLMVTSALDAPANRRSKLRALTKASAFNQLVDPKTNASTLQSNLSSKLAADGYLVDESATVVLNYKLLNRLSEDTRTLELQTKYSLRSIKTLDKNKQLHTNTVHVQYTVADTWNAEKLRLAMDSAIEQTAMLIAMDLSESQPQGTRVAVNTIRGNHQSSITATSIQTLPANKYSNYRLKNGELFAISGESSNLFLRTFVACNDNC